MRQANPASGFDLNAASGDVSWSYTRKLRDECQNETLFTSLAHARSELAEWQHDYNTCRPHSKLGGRGTACHPFNHQPNNGRILLLNGNNQGSTSEAMFDPDEVRALLLAHARAGEAITYAETLEALGHRFTRPKMRQLCKVLVDVDAHARGLGEPEMAVLVVRQSDRLPGQGWWVGGGAAGYSGAWEGLEAHRHVTQLQRRVFDYWSKRALL